MCLVLSSIVLSLPAASLPGARLAFAQRPASQPPPPNSARAKGLSNQHAPFKTALHVHVARFHMSDSEDSDAVTGTTPKAHLQFSSSDDVIAAISLQAEQLSEKRAATRCGALGKLRDILCAHNCIEELENWKESLCGSFSSCFKSGSEEEQLLALRCAILLVITLAPEDADLAERLETSFRRLKSEIAPAVAANLMLFRCCVCWMHSDVRATAALMGEVLYSVAFVLKADFP
jgi:hypothetical protein